MNSGVHTQLTGSAPSDEQSWDVPIATKQIFWLDKHLPDPQDQRDYTRDRCVTAFTEALGEAMRNANLSRAGLAEKLGKSRGQISRLFSGAQNMTLHTLADVLWACSMEIVDPMLAWGPLGVIEVPMEYEPAWATLAQDFVVDSRAPPEAEASQASLLVSTPHLNIQRVA